MSILYSLLACDDVVLAECSTSDGDFVNVAYRLVKKIGGTGSSSTSKKRSTYHCGEFTFYVLLDGRWMFLCFANKTLGMKVPFSFLGDVKGLYVPNIEDDSKILKKPYALNEEISPKMKQLLDGYNLTAPTQNKSERITKNLDDVRENMVDNIEKVLKRGAKIDNLVDQSMRLSEQAHGFAKDSKRLRQKLWWDNMKMKVVFMSVIMLALLVMVYLLYDVVETFPRAKSKAINSWGVTRP